jgi:hypothetical protein
MSDVMRLQFLYEKLWGKRDKLHDTIFRLFIFPCFNTETDMGTDTDSYTDINTDMKPQGRRKMCAAEKLSISGIGSGTQLKIFHGLPCGANELLVRGAYREMYDILVAKQEGRLNHVRDAELIPDQKKFILILGQPGIGKTWFLTYVLVRRLLEGMPTIFQVAKRSDGDGGVTGATHYLINGNGVHLLPDPPPASERYNPEIWVLADRKPVGIPREAPDHSWLVVVASSPREVNYHYLVKDYSPQKFYLPAWDWEEVVAAA